MRATEPIPSEVTIVENCLALRQTELIDMPDISPITEAAESMRGVIDPTPLEELAFASDLTQTRVVVKREDLTEVGSFKVRGAYNKMRKLPESRRAQGVVVRSAGNHAQGSAMAGWLLNIPVTVYMPLTAPQSKVDATRKWGAEVVQVGDNYSETIDITNESLAEDPRPDIPAYDDEDVINAQGTVGYEILEQEATSPLFLFQVAGAVLVQVSPRRSKHCVPM